MMEGQETVSALMHDKMYPGKEEIRDVTEAISLHIVNFRYHASGISPGSKLCGEIDEGWGHKHVLSGVSMSPLRDFREVYHDVQGICSSELALVTQGFDTTVRR